MTKTKPNEWIAERFQISRESAKFFLGRVQKSFKTEKPPQQLIVEFMEGLEFDALPKPYHIARGMYEGGLWVHPMASEPVELMDEEDVYFE